VEVVERRDQLTARQIARGVEDDDGLRWRAAPSSLGSGGQAALPRAPPSGMRPSLLIWVTTGS
jgi:hypothetical protein